MMKPGVIPRMTLMMMMKPGVIPPTILPSPSSTNRTYAIYNPPSSPNSQPIAVKLGGLGGSSGGQQGGGQLGFPATYNELPLPSGDWRKNYIEQQQKYNKHLIVGIVMFGVTVFVLRRNIDFMMSPVSLDPIGEDLDEAEFCKVQVEVKKCE